MSTRDFSWGKGGRCVWLTTFHPCSDESREDLGLNQPGTPRATLACRGIPLLYFNDVRVHRAILRRCRFLDVDRRSLISNFDGFRKVNTPKQLNRKRLTSHSPHDLPLTCLPSVFSSNFFRSVFVSTMHNIVPFSLIKSISQDSR